MPDPNVTVIAIETHAAALDGAIQRHSTNAGRCKGWSVGIIAGAMVFAGGKEQMGALPWVGGVVLVLAIADACHVALARRATAAYNGFMRKLPLNGGTVPKAEDWLMLSEPEPGWKQVGPAMRAMLSLSVWPFYVALLALLAGFYIQESEAAAAKPAGSGKVVTSSGAMKVLPRPTPSAPGAPLPGNAKFPTQPGLPPKQPAGISQPRILSPQPGARPATPLNRPPGSALPPQSGAVPPNPERSPIAVPPNGVQPNDVPPQNTSTIVPIAPTAPPAPIK